MAFAMHYKHLVDFCICPGKPGLMEGFEEGAHELVDKLEVMVFGPRPEGEFPIHTGPWVKAVPGDDPAKFQVSAPDTITYPANALLFAARKGLPLINDTPELPIPGIPANAKDNAKLLATILTMESVALVLPKVKPLTPEALKDFRGELEPYVRPFRLAMLKLSRELNAGIADGATLPEIQKQARFLAETDVYPRLAELDVVIQNPKKHWYRRATDLAKDAPALAANFATMPMHLAIAKVLAKIAGALADVRDEQTSREKEIAKSGLYYLLKLRDSTGKS